MIDIGKTLIPVTMGDCTYYIREATWKKANWIQKKVKSQTVTETDLSRLSILVVNSEAEVLKNRTGKTSSRIKAQS